MKYRVFTGTSLFTGTSFTRTSLLTGTLLCVAGLSGCGTFFGEDGLFRDRGDDYLKAGSIPAMQVPDGTDQDALGQLYSIPPVSKAAYEYPDKFEAPRPEALSTNVYSETVKIQRLGEEHWIFVNASPSEIWPRVRGFLNNNGLQVSRVDPPQGIIETAWLKFKDETETRDKYRIRIEQGVQPDSAEIHVTHLSMPQAGDIPARVNWPARSSSAERESWMVNELAVSLAAEIGSASASLLAQTIGGSEKVSIVAGDRGPVLHIELEMIRAWASLNHALQQEGLRIVDQDSDAGIYYVLYESPEQDGEGFFSGWFNREEPVKRYTLAEVLSHLQLADTPANRALFPPQAFQGGKQALKDAAGYLFIVKQQAGAVDVVIRDVHGQTLEARNARELLGMARRNLI